MRNLVLMVVVLCGVMAGKTKPKLKPEVRLPEAYSRELGGEQGLREWWKLFGDRVLEQLMELMVENNRDVKLAEARTATAQAAVANQKAGLMPSATPSFSYANSQRSNNSPAIPRIEGGPVATDLIPRRYSLFETGMDVSYDLDLARGNRKQVEAKRWEAVAQMEALADTKVRMAAELGRLYFDLREAQGKLEARRRRAELIETSIELLEKRYRAGLVAEREVLEWKAQRASVKGELAGLEAQEEQARVGIAVLTGEVPETIARVVGTGGAMGAMPGQVPGGLPADLLKRRPDVKQAWAEFEAAVARRKSAETDWFPKLKLTSNVGGQSGDLWSVLAGGSIVSSFMPKVSWGALNFQQTKLAIREKEAREMEQMRTFEKAMLKAFEEVEQALSGYWKQRERWQHLREASERNGEMRVAAERRYRAGVETLLPVLEAERGEWSAREQVVEAQATACRNLVSLYRALGGGW